MNSKWLLFSILFLVITCKQENYSSTTANSHSNSSESTFNESLANELGADEYGMKSYVMAFLYRGDSRDNFSKNELDSLQTLHLKNIGELANSGKLAVAGPFLDEGNLRGIYIFNVSSVDEAEQLTNTDPSIKAGILKMELKPWYSSAALNQVNTIHQQIAKTKL